MVYEDVDGNGTRDIFSGEMGLAGWTIQLFWNGQVIASTTTLDDGSFSFPGLGNTAYEACVSVQTGYTQTQPVAGDGIDESFSSVPMFVSSVDQDPNIDGIQNVWIAGVGCAEAGAQVHFSR